LHGVLRLRRLLTRVLGGVHAVGDLLADAHELGRAILGFGEAAALFRELQIVEEEAALGADPFVQRPFALAAGIQIGNVDVERVDIAIIPIAGEIGKDVERVARRLVFGGLGVRAAGLDEGVDVPALFQAVKEVLEILGERALRQRLLALRPLGQLVEAGEDGHG